MGLKQRLWFTFLHKVNKKILNSMFGLRVGMGVKGLDYDFGSSYIHLSRPYVSLDRFSIK
jgi:hypothetical protein